jgi:hypothetical protein
MVTNKLLIFSEILERTTPSVWYGLVPSPLRSSSTIFQGFWDGCLLVEHGAGHK